MIYTSFVIRVNDTSICFSFLKENEAFEENNNISSRIFDVFSLILFKDNKHHLESSCLIDNMIEQNLINNNFVKNKKISYIVQKLTLGTDSFIFKGITFKYNEYVIYRNLIENFNQLSKNNWELHNNLIKEGVNPNEIAKIIRNDEIGKLQEISSQANFNFNQTIEPSFYERCSFIIQINVTLIDYAAFFGSIKCFKYLLVNGATLENTGKYAVAGGNEEIFYLCLQNHSSFKDVYETAIKFHKNDIFKYIYENKIIENCDLEDLGKKCIHHHNFDLFLYLQEEGMKINNVIINEAAKDGNIFIVEYFLELNQIPSDILVFSSESENIELVRYILDQGKINVNTKNKEEKTALMKASEYGRTEIVKLLLEQKGIDINAKDNNRSTALIYATEKKHIAVVKLLLNQKEIDVNAKDKEGKTALMTAAECGWTEIVKMLLRQKGINKNAKDNIGITAAQYAMRDNHYKIVKTIINHKVNYAKK